MKSTYYILLTFIYFNTYIHRKLWPLVCRHCAFFWELATHSEHRRWSLLEQAFKKHLASTDLGVLNTRPIETLGLMLDRIQLLICSVYCLFLNRQPQLPRGSARNQLERKLGMTA